MDINFDALGETLGIILSFVVMFVGIIVAIVKKSKDKVETAYEQPFDETDKNAQGFLTDEQIRYQNQLKTRKATAQTPKTSSTIDFHANGHSHAGATETYDPIVGSLGEHSDEGCDELNGVRLIATDLMYQDDNDNVAYDYDAIRKSIIWGEVLNNARFKHPYGKK